MTRARCAPAALIALLLVGAPAAAAPRGAPALRFDAETCDVGSVVQGEQPACDFTFANAGGAELRILQVEPTCGCTSALLSSDRLAPGERGRIRVVFDSENFAGEVVKEIEVRSNDPGRPQLTVRLRAVVEPEIEFEPSTVQFDGVHAGDRVVQEVVLTNRRAEAVRVLSLEGEPSSYLCTLAAWTDRSQPLVLESWDRTVLQVALAAPPSLPMPLPGACTLRIEGPRKRVFRLKLLALPAL
jgi:hypothetical protein